MGFICICELQCVTGLLSDPKYHGKQNANLTFCCIGGGVRIIGGWKWFDVAIIGGWKN